MTRLFKTINKSDIRLRNKCNRSDRKGPKPGAKCSHPLTNTHCIMKSVLNNSHSFNMFIQMLFFPDDTDIFNILEEIGMKEYKNVFKENMVRKN